MTRWSRSATSGRPRLVRSLHDRPTVGCPPCVKDPLNLTFSGVKAGTYLPGNTRPDGVHYDVHGNLWVGCAGLGGMLEIDPRGVILGFAAIPNGDAATTNFEFGGPDNQYTYFEGSNSGMFWLQGDTRRPILA